MNVVFISQVDRQEDKTKATEHHTEQTEATEEFCKAEGCTYRGKSLLCHLARTKKNCMEYYNINSLREEKKRKHNKYYHQENKAAISESRKRHHQENKATISESKKRHYQDNRPGILESRKRHHQENRPAILESKKSHYQENRPKILKDKKKHYQHRKNIEFANEDEKARHMKFHIDLRDCFSCKCVCGCHKIMSKSGVHDVKVTDLKDRLDRESPGLFEKSIQYPVPEDVYLNKKTYICSTCRKWLHQKKRMPKHSVMNGLDKDEKLPLTELESVLISKNILFLKIRHLPKSQFPAVLDKTVNVPILDDDILKNLNSVQAFPRKPDESGLVPVQLKRKMEYKNKHFEAYVRPEALYKALRDLKEWVIQAIKILRLGNGALRSLKIWRKILTLIQAQVARKIKTGILPINISMNLMVQQ